MIHSGGVAAASGDELVPGIFLRRDGKESKKTPIGEHRHVHAIDEECGIT
jgi:hypothetical protein